MLLSVEFKDFPGGTIVDGASRKVKKRRTGIKMAESASVPKGFPEVSGKFGRRLGTKWMFCIAVSDCSRNGEIQ